MSFYSMIFGGNPSTKEILAALSLTELDVERFRDCWINEDDEEIVIFARTGGWNREDYPNRALTQHPLYLYDEDDDFDNTYAYYHFSLPELLKEE